MTSVSNRPSIAQLDYQARQSSSTNPRSVLDRSPTAMDRLAAERTTSEGLSAGTRDEPLVDLGNAGAAALGTQLPLPVNRISGSGAVKAYVAASILENVADGQPSTRPELGRVSW